MNSVGKCLLCFPVSRFVLVSALQKLSSANYITHVCFFAFFVRRVSSDDDQTNFALSFASDVCPFVKNGDSNHKGNYMPINVLSVTYNNL